MQFTASSVLSGQKNSKNKFYHCQLSQLLLNIPCYSVPLLLFVQFAVLFTPCIIQFAVLFTACIITIMLINEQVDELLSSSLFSKLLFHKYNSVHMKFRRHDVAVPLYLHACTSGLAHISKSRSGGVTYTL